MDIVIKSGEQHHVPEILNLFRETIYEVCREDYTPAQLKAWASHDQQLDKWRERIDTQFFKVATINGRIVGVGSLQGNYLDLLYVHKDYQGHRIASKLYDVLEQQARSDGTSELISDVSKTALSFFQRLGFEIIREQSRFVRSEELVNFRMEKRLNQSKDLR